MQIGDPEYMECRQRSSRVIGRKVRRWLRHRRAVEQAAGVVSMTQWLRQRSVCGGSSAVHGVLEGVVCILQYILVKGVRLGAYFLGRVVAEEDEQRACLTSQEAYTRLLLTVEHLVVPMRIAVLTTRTPSRPVTQYITSTLLKTLGYLSDLFDSHEVFTLCKGSIKAWDHALAEMLTLSEAVQRRDILEVEASDYACWDLYTAELLQRRRLHTQRALYEDFYRSLHTDLVYETLRYLGRGSQGEVLLVRYEGREVALKKVLYSGLNELFEGFLKAREHQQHVHPNIVTYLRVHAAMDRVGRPLLSILMEYYHQGDLGRTRGVGYKESATIVAQVCEGLAYLHTRVPPVVHRDVKLDNVLIQDGCAVLSDFGTARPLVASVISSQGGTFQYTAPETLFLFRTTPSSDMFSVGVMLYILFTGSSVLAHPEAGTELLLNSEKWERGALEPAMWQYLAARGVPELLISLVVTLTRHDQRLRLTAPETCKVLATVLELL